AKFIIIGEVRERCNIFDTPLLLSVIDLLLSAECVEAPWGFFFISILLDSEKLHDSIKPHHP
ncbi:MAG: hypothetical protein IIZ78_19645, partial [Clostridiales bacterium]|nr:hypothetical protein [Clostridiales bacterium]